MHDSEGPHSGETRPRRLSAPSRHCNRNTLPRLAPELWVLSPSRGEVMSAKKGRSWKLERASVNVKGQDRPRSSKYSGSDSKGPPRAGSRARVWVGGYTRADGTKVNGYYRATPHAG